MFSNLHVDLHAHMQVNMQVLGKLVCKLFFTFWFDNAIMKHSWTNGGKFCDTNLIHFLQKKEK